MESQQMQRPHGHGHDQEQDPHQHAVLHSAVEGEDEGDHHHGKGKAVLKKVKAKAKKIKDVITKHGHGHDHEHGYEQGHVQEGYEEDEEEDEDEETAQDPEVHGAPMYESSVIRSNVLGKGVKPGQHGANLEKPMDEREDRYEAKGTINFGHENEGIRTRTDAEHKPLIQGHEGVTAHTPMQVDRAPHLHGHEGMTGQMGSDFGRPQATDIGRVPVGHAEEGIGSGVGRTRPMEERRGNEDFTCPSGTNITGGPVSGQQIGVPAGLDEDPNSPKKHLRETPPSNYQSKVTDPTGTGGGEAGVAPLIHQLGEMTVHREPESEPKPEAESGPRIYTGSHDQFAPQSSPIEDQFVPASAPLDTSRTQENPNPESERKHYDASNPEGMPRDTVTGKISSATSAIADKAVAAKNVVASKLGYGTDHEQGQETENYASITPTEVNNNVSGKPGDASSDTIPGKISSATSVIADKAASAKNVVAAKLGYGRGHQVGEEATKPEKGGEGTKSTSSSTSEYAHKAVASVTEKLAPVYGAVAGAGTAVMSKVQGHGTGQEGEDKGSNVSQESKISGPDKGVSVKEYLAEKFRPGDEDKALSEVISGALQKKKGEAEPEKRGQATRPMGAVTESEEVAKRLGTGHENKREGEDAIVSGGENVGSGSSVVDKLKGAVSSWLGKSSGMRTAQESANQSYVDIDSSTVGEHGQAQAQRSE